MQINCDGSDASSRSLLMRQQIPSNRSQASARRTSVDPIAIHQMLMQFSISGTSLSVKKLDNATTA
jgi:hypothetical protein